MGVNSLEEHELLSSSAELEKLRRELEPDAPPDEPVAPSRPAHPVLAPWTRVTSTGDAKALATASLSPTDGFLLSRIPQEGMTVEEIVDVTRLGSGIISESLGRLQTYGLVFLA